MAPAGSTGNISACQTLLARTWKARAAGLTRAFIYAGAQDVVCTLWPVADEHEGTDGLVLRRLLSGRMWTGHQRRPFWRNAATSDPFYWAGFTVVRGRDRSGPRATASRPGVAWPGAVGPGWRSRLATAPPAPAEAAAMGLDTGSQAGMLIA